MAEQGDVEATKCPSTEEPHTECKIAEFQMSSSRDAKESQLAPNESKDNIADSA